MDYIKYEGSPDPIKFINKEGTYVSFLTKVEDDMKRHFTHQSNENGKLMQQLANLKAENSNAEIPEFDENKKTILFSSGSTIFISRKLFVSITWCCFKKCYCHCKQQIYCKR